jgi:hypothetical protein
MRYNIDIRQRKPKPSARRRIEMAAIYDYETAALITEGLQGSDVCDEAAWAAKRIAKDLGKAVILEDDDGLWIAGPRGGVRNMTQREKRDGGWIESENEEIWTPEEG